ncbi:low molecular weight protein-tyrosine-phosphatase [Marinomonas dokdonensis]|uniref:low molecular weight protein-tyrosine-phosphatase n=1 Tax=Marinomonas dokdonensis TaxID=328224 RepID=UPI0040553A28
MKHYKILTVCLGNICRSPAAQGLLEFSGQAQKLDLQVDSAGTAAYHIGKQPDRRSIKTLAGHGIDIRSQAARQVKVEDFDYYDWILAMDKSNLKDLKAIQPKGSSAKLVLFGQFDASVNWGEIADPYYGEDEGFESMYDHLKQISDAFIQHLLHSD